MTSDLRYFAERVDWLRFYGFNNAFSSLHHKLPFGVARAGVDVRDVGTGGEVADVDLGADIADGLDKEQLTGEVGDGHCVDGQVFRTFDGNMVGGGVRVESDTVQPLVILRHCR